MPSSNRGMSGRGNGTITVIQEPVLRAYRRKAKIVFYVTWVITAVLAATVAASRWHPIIALLAGLACGYILGAAAGGIVAAWPVLRAIWWWAPETVITGSLVFGWIELADHTTLPVRLTATAALVGVPAAIRPVRTRLHQACWCLVTRHRIRTSFSEFIIKNRTGSLPLILWARPTPVGERVWIWLRPGLSLDDLQNRLDKIAVACWASTALAEAASRSNAAFVRLGISGGDVGTSYLLPRIVGPTLAFEMMLTGRLIDADEALRSGMVLRVVPDGEVLAAAVEIAEAIVANSRFGVQMTKQLMWSNLDAPDLRSAILAEDRTQVLCLTTPEARAAIPAMLESRRSR